jgi:hypothetical protein
MGETTNSGPRLVVEGRLARVEEGNDTTVFWQEDACRRLLASSALRPELEETAEWLGDQADALTRTLIEVPARYQDVHGELSRQAARLRGRAALIRRVLAGAFPAAPAAGPDDEPEEPTPLAEHDLGGEG